MIRLGREPLTDPSAPAEQPPTLAVGRSRRRCLRGDGGPVSFPAPETAADVEQAPVAQETSMPLPVLFGANVEPHSLPVGRSSEQALLIDSLGLALLTIQDPPYQGAYDDTWTLLPFLAARTRHVTLSRRSAPCRYVRLPCWR